MTCPLCGDSEALVVGDPAELNVNCESCGSFRMAHAAVEEWRALAREAREVVLPHAREHVKILSVFMSRPPIQADDISAWRRMSTWPK